MSGDLFDDFMVALGKLPLEQRTFKFRKDFITKAFIDRAKDIEELHLTIGANEIGPEIVPTVRLVISPGVGFDVVGMKDEHRARVAFMLEAIQMRDLRQANFMETKILALNDRIKELHIQNEDLGRENEELREEASLNAAVLRLEDRVSKLETHLSKRPVETLYEDMSVDRFDPKVMGPNPNLVRKVH